MSARDRIAVWLDDDQELRIPDTPWGRALYADLREVLAAASYDEWACKGNQQLYAEAAAERDELRVTVARVEAERDALAALVREAALETYTPDGSERFVAAFHRALGERDALAVKLAAVEGLVALETDTPGSVDGLLSSLRDALGGGS